MRAIQTERAKQALWMWAENNPNLLLQWFKNDPASLLEVVESKVHQSFNQKTLLEERGVPSDIAQEMAMQMLMPDEIPDEWQEVEVTEQQMKKILNRLKTLAKTIPESF
jgi:hypothetical protein